MTAVRNQGTVPRLQCAKSSTEIISKVAYKDLRRTATCMLWGVVHKKRKIPRVLLCKFSDVK
jgi:hypothetical protein